MGLEGYPFMLKKETNNTDNKTLATLDSLGFSLFNTLTLMTKVSVGKKGLNYVFAVNNPSMTIGHVYDFVFILDRRKAEEVSLGYNGEGEFSLFGHYKSDHKQLCTGWFKYKQERSQQELPLRVVFNKAIDPEYIKNAKFELIVKGLTVSEPIVYSRTEKHTINEVLGTTGGKSSGKDDKETGFITDKRLGK